jgi:hypothetical protein
VDAASLLGELDAAAAEARRTAAASLAALAKSGGLDETAARRLLRAVEADPSPPVRSAASTALGWTAERGVVLPDALPAIVRLLGDVDGMIRHDAAWVIERWAEKGCGDASCVPALLANLAHANDDTRAATVYCLGVLHRHGFAPASVRDRIRELAADPSEGVRKAVSRTLG